VRFGVQCRGIIDWAGAGLVFCGRRAALLAGIPRALPCSVFSVRSVRKSVAESVTFESSVLLASPVPPFCRSNTTNSDLHSTKIKSYPLQLLVQQLLRGNKIRLDLDL
jgi:hypothetical protein